jgi:hypothetical protein
MKLAPGTYYFKDGKIFVLVEDGERVGEVATRAEAKTWHAKVLRADKLLVRAILRAAKGRYYAAIQGY